MRTTLKDIANHANVSVSLVGNVLNDRPGVWASQQTRERIRAAARHLNYRPNTAARNLQRGHTNCVAFVYTRGEITSMGGGSKSGVEVSADLLARAGYELKLCAFEDQAATLAALRDMAQSASVDMAVLWSVNAEDVRQQAQVAAEANLPFVAVGRFDDIHPEWPQVDFDHEGMMRESVDRLWKHGHRNIAYIGHDNDLPYSRALVSGFREALGMLSGATVSDHAILRCPDGYGTPERVAAAVSRWMTRPADERITGIVMGDGGGKWKDVEVALLEHSRFIGFEPEDIEVTGLGYYQGHLMFGDAVVVSAVDEAMVASEMVVRLVLPLLRGETPAGSVVRVIPPMTPLRDPAFTPAQRERLIRAAT